VALYYFDWRDNDQFIEDDEGLECADLQQVKTEAARALIDHARDVFPGHDRRELAIEVRSARNQPILKTILILEVQPLQLGQ
jgi:hypothetical protein